MSGTYANGGMKPFTIGDLLKASEELKPLGDAIRIGEERVFATVVFCAAKHRLTWAEAKAEIVAATPSEHQDAMSAAINAAWRRALAPCWPPPMAPKEPR